jgi:hypothetical protein
MPFSVALLPRLPSQDQVFFSAPPSLNPPPHNSRNEVSAILIITTGLRHGGEEEFYW